MKLVFVTIVFFIFSMIIVILGLQGYWYQWGIDKEMLAAFPYWFYGGQFILILSFVYKIWRLS